MFYTGGLIILGLLLNGWSIQDCEQNFIALAKQAFKPRQGIFGVPLLWPVLRFLISLLADSQYSENAIQGAVQEAFGSTKSLLDSSYAHKTGTKIGVTTTTIENSSPCILSNYGSAANHGSGYSVVRPSTSDVLVWQA